MTGEPRLRVTRLSKSFPGLRALDQVSFELTSGEIVALVGQNGSGKSTLVKTLIGVYDADQGGLVQVRGPDGAWLTGAAAQAQLHVIHQDLALVGGLNTIENLDLGSSHGRRWLAPNQRAAERARATEWIARFGGTFDPTVPVARLAPAERTLVAIARALSGWERPDQVLILDEPTAALHGDEVQRLFEATRRVAAHGAAVLFISHRLDEVMELADRVIALRGGRKVADVAAGAFDHEDLVRMIVGYVTRPAADASTRQRSRERVLSVRGLQDEVVDELDFDVHGGEVVGISGLLGSGRERVCGLVFGARPRLQGVVEVDGRTLPHGRPRTSVAADMGFVPADRHAEGAIAQLSALENLTLPRLRPLTHRWGKIRKRAERAEADAWAARVELRPPDPSRPLELFSGGNQQKVVLARWLRLQPRVLLLDEPTQGVDVGAKAAIYRLIIDAAAAGTAVMVASSDETELSELCHRVLVMRDGRIAAELTAGRLNEADLVRENLGLASHLA